MGNPKAGFPCSKVKIKIVFTGINNHSESTPNISLYLTHVSSKKSIGAKRDLCFCRRSPTPHRSVEQSANTAPPQDSATALTCQTISRRGRHATHTFPQPL
ncbi:hypothetical protein JTE90_025908 [Oedothorax gibbosus]|uniref:Uncharacterized protein n=1 Tax=Oedothorax gibbosus TaxID=931172 RepID=A0AAV6UTP4_9ARAC|nr:hypothetical protein JTE90_025908 [Oedothorax gibbosus]